MTLTKPRRLVLASALALALSGIAYLPAAARAQTPPTVTIAAAANLTEVFNEQIIPAFTKQTGIKVQPTYAATGLLARQLEQGAPYQVFCSADDTTVPLLAGEHLVDPNSVKTYATGQLMLWSKSLPVDKQGLSVLGTPAVTHIAIANPKTAPYGAASIEALARTQMLAGVQPKIVYAENIRQSLQYAQSGNAEVSFTALSFAKEAGGHVFIVPANLHAPIRQSVGVTTSATPAARRFEAFLLSKTAVTLLATYGYLPPRGR